MAKHESKVSLKLVVDKTRNKVVFAEAGKEFVDFLFNLMSMPIGTVTHLLTKKSMVGSIGNLYGSIENLSENYLRPKQTKGTLLKPKLIPSSASQALQSLLPTHHYEVPEPKAMNHCQNYHNNPSCRSYVADHPQAICPNCRSNMNYAAIYVSPAAATTMSEGSVFVKGLVTFKVTDDLVVMPMVDFTKLINEFGAKEIDNIEERVVHLGTDQGMMLLKESLQSDIVLTNVFPNQQLHI